MVGVCVVRAVASLVHSAQDPRPSATEGRAGKGRGEVLCTGKDRTQDGHTEMDSEYGCGQWRPGYQASQISRQQRTGEGGPGYISVHEEPPLDLAVSGRKGLRPSDLTGIPGVLHLCSQLSRKACRAGTKRLLPRPSTGPRP